MDFGLSDIQKEYRQSIIDFVRSNINTYCEEKRFNRELWKNLSDFGILGMSVSEEYNGLGEDFLTSIIAMEALGYACNDNGLVFAVSNHIWVSQNLIFKYGSDYLKNKYLKGMVSGEIIGAYALTESEAGSDSFNMQTRAEKAGDKYILNGSKIFISNGPIADVFIVMAKTDRVSQLGGITAFVIDKNNQGVYIGKEIKKMGLASCPMCEISLQNCEVSEADVLGRVGDGSNIINLAMEWERCFEFASHVGTMQRLMEKCIKYANEREQFGKKIGDFQSISNKIADMKVSIELSRLLLYKIGWMKDKGKRSFIESAILKLFVSESYIKAALDTLQIHGAYGYAQESGIEEEVRDALASSIYSGTNEIQRNIIYRMIK